LKTTVAFRARLPDGAAAEEVVSATEATIVQTDTAEMSTRMRFIV